MFANFLPFLTRQSSLAPNFVLEVTKTKRPRRTPQVERLFAICWVLIAVKHVAIIWAVNNYPIPFHHLWINFPTWLLGVLATGIYYGRTRR